MNISRLIISLPLALTVSALCHAKNEITIGELTSNPKAYAGKEIALRCLVRSANLGSVTCAEGSESVSLSSRTMDKASLKFSLAHCTKPSEADNDAKCRDIVVTARLKDPSRPGWLDHAKMKLKGK